MSGKLRMVVCLVGSIVVASIVGVVLVTQAEWAHAGKPAQPLPPVTYALQFIGSASIQPTGSMSPINDRNEVVGNAVFADSTSGPYLYNANDGSLVKLEDLVVEKTFVDPGTGTTYTRHLTQFEGTNDLAACINNNGDVAACALVVDDSNPSNWYSEGCLLRPDGIVRPDGWERYEYVSLGDIIPVAINDDGVVAGWIEGWKVGISRTPGVIENMGQFNSDGTRPSAISASNTEGDFHIVGWTSNNGGWIRHPNGTWTQPTWSGGRANWINGVVVGANGTTLMATGSARVSRRESHAFKYTEGGAMVDLGSLGGSSYGNGINASGRVVGHAELGTGGQRAFLYYDATFGMTNLDKLIPTSDPNRPAFVATTASTSAVGINNYNCICGQGVFDGEHRAFVLIPQPQ